MIIHLAGDTRFVTKSPRHPEVHGSAAPHKHKNKAQARRGSSGSERAELLQQSSQEIETKRESLRR